MTEVDLQVVEILRNFGSQERFIGVVDHYDLAGTTAYIRSVDQFYLRVYLRSAGTQAGSTGEL